MSDAVSAIPPPQPGPAALPAPGSGAVELDYNHVALGLLLSVLMLVLQVPLGLLAIPVARLFGAGDAAAFAAFLPAVFFGVSQFLYVIPTAIWLQMNGRKRTALGLWIGAGVLFLLDAACLALLFLVLDGLNGWH